MAVDVANLIRIWARRELMVLRAMLIGPSLCNRDHQTALMSAYATKVSSYKVDRMAESTARGADWPTETEVTRALVDFALDKQSMMASSILYLDELEFPLSLVQDEADIQARGHATRINKTVFDTIIAGVGSGATTTIAAADNPHITTAGEWAADNSADNTKAKQDLIMKALYDAIVTWGVLANEAGYDQDGMSPLGRWCVMRAAVWRVFNDWLIDQGLSEQVKTALTLNRRLASSNMGAVAIIDGVTIIRNPGVTNVAGDTSSSTNGAWNVLMGTRSATSFASRRPLRQAFNPRQNQGDKPGWRLRGMHNYGCKVLDNRTLRKVVLPGPESLTEDIELPDLMADERHLTAADLEAQYGGGGIWVPAGADITIKAPANARAKKK